MIIYSLLEICAFLFVLAFVVTQMVFPMIKGTKMFPIFRREHKLYNDVVDLNQKVVEKGLETEIKNIKKEKGVK